MQIVIVLYDRFTALDAVGAPAGIVAAMRARSRFILTGRS